MALIERENEELKNYCDVMQDNANEAYNEYETATSELQRLAKEAEESFDASLCAKDEEIGQLKEKFSKIEKLYEIALKNVKEAEKKLSKFNPRNMKRREDRRKFQISQLKLKLTSEKNEKDKIEEELTQQISDLENKWTNLEKKMQSEKEKVKNLELKKETYQKKCSYLKSKIKKKDDIIIQKNEEENEIDQQWLQIRRLE